MARQITCPRCGAPESVANPGIAMLVCSHCNASIYFGEQEALSIGRESILPESDSRLYLGATGSVRGRRFEVIGQLRYSYGRGHWDEWYLELADGGEIWLSEDERQLRLQDPVELPGAPPPGALAPGVAIPFRNGEVTVRERGMASLIGGKGQLPYRVVPGDQYPYVECASHDGVIFLTLEYDADGTLHAYAGNTLGHEELLLDEPKPTEVVSAPQGQGIECSNCRGPLEVPPRSDIQTLVCEYCGAQLDLTTAERRVLGQNPDGYKPEFLFEVGEAATFDKVRYEVCGRMVYVESEEGHHYITFEYLLYAPDAGYLWLSQYHGHFVLNRQTEAAPRNPLEPFTLPPKYMIEFGGRTYNKYENGTVKLQYVDGAIPWRARVGDRFGYAEIVRPPEIVSIDRDGDELDCFVGRYLPADELWKAFDKKGRPPRGHGVHAAQPYRRGWARTMVMLLGFLGGVANIGLLVWSLGLPNKELYVGSFSPQQYLTESVSDAFEIPAGPMLGLELSAPLDNSWVALDLALVDDKSEEVRAEMDGELAYYSGVEGGESWSEGSRNDSWTFQAPPAGTYRLLFKGAAGSGENSPPRGEALQVKITSVQILSRYFLAGAILCLLFPLFEMLHRHSFEARRWSAVIDDDDDDDDWDWD